MLKIDYTKRYESTFKSKKTTLISNSNIQLIQRFRKIKNDSPIFKQDNIFLKLMEKGKMSYEQAIKKSGIIIKDNLAIIKENGKKYTGIIQGFQSFNRKKTTKFVDGKLTEKIYHNFWGQELNGEFYSNGIKRYAVSNGNRNFVLYSFDDTGNLVSRITCTTENKSKFDIAREALAEL